MIQETSKESYIDILSELGDRQLQVYNIIKKGRSLNNTMISRDLGLPINSVTPRVNELRKKGLVIESGRYICPYTRRLTIYWKVK